MGKLILKATCTLRLLFMLLEYTQNKQTILFLKNAQKVRHHAFYFHVTETFRRKRWSRSSLTQSRKILAESMNTK